MFRPEYCVNIGIEKIEDAMELVKILTKNDYACMITDEGVNYEIKAVYTCEITGSAMMMTQEDLDYAVDEIIRGIKESED